MSTKAPPARSKPILLETEAPPCEGGGGPARRRFSSTWRRLRALALPLAGAGALLAPFFIPANAAVLATDGARFTVNGKPAFLLGFSYYGALGAPEDFIRRDLDDFKRLGFNWLRVWATWNAFGTNISAVDTNGQPRKPFLAKLRWLVRQCDNRGLVVDITVSRSPELLPGLAAHRQAVATLVSALKQHRNWYLDLANERDVLDGRYVPVDELRILRQEVRKLDRRRLVTASFGGHDLDEDDVRQALVRTGLDFLCPHRPRTPDSPGQTAEQTYATIALMKALGQTAPILYQEPFRRGYGDWQPGADAFLADLRGAQAGGAAGWCFHNGQERNAPGQRPRRSFDLRQQRLFEQLDDEELKFVRAAKAALSRAP